MKEGTEKSVMTIKGVGRIEYFEFENERGKGTKLAKEFIRYARCVGKNVYGRAKSDNSEEAMDNSRLMRWYKSLGAKPIFMKDNPSAMKLEIR